MEFEFLSLNQTNPSQEGFFVPNIRIVLAHFLVIA